MQFQVPKFIEHQAKIVGPFTFNQFMYLALAGVFSFLLYTSLPFNLFLIGSIFLFGGALVLALLKIEGRSLPVVLKNFLGFKTAPKLYLWKRKPFKIITIKKKVLKEKEEEDIEKKSFSLNVAGESQIRDLSTKIETKTK